MSHRARTMQAGDHVQVLRADGVRVTGDVVDNSDFGVCVTYAGVVGGARSELVEKVLTHWFLPSALPRASGSTSALFLDRLGASFVVP